MENELFFWRNFNWRYKFSRHNDWWFDWKRRHKRQKEMNWMKREGKWSSFCATFSYSPSKSNEFCSCNNNNIHTHTLSTDDMKIKRIMRKTESNRTLSALRTCASPFSLSHSLFLHMSRVCCEVNIILICAGVEWYFSLFAFFFSIHTFTHVQHIHDNFPWFSMLALPYEW